MGMRAPLVEIKAMPVKDQILRFTVVFSYLTSKSELSIKPAEGRRPQKHSSLT
jgi:hypothetical protein